MPRQSLVLRTVTDDHHLRVELGGRGGEVHEALLLHQSTDGDHGATVGVGTVAAERVAVDTHDDRVHAGRWSELTQMASAVVARARGECCALEFLDEVARRLKNVVTVRHHAVGDTHDA